MKDNEDIQFDGPKLIKKGTNPLEIPRIGDLVKLIKKGTNPFLI